MATELRTPRVEGSVFPMHVRFTRERTFVDKGLDQDLDAESVEAKRPALRGSSGEVV